LNKKSSQWLQQITFLGPSLLFFSVMILIPFLIGIYYSFTEWNGISDDPRWVGWENWITVFTDDRDFRNSFIFTMKFTLVNVAAINLVAFTLALLLTRALKGKKIYRTIYFLPNVIGGLILGYIFQFIYTRAFASVGEITGIGLFQLPWLGTAETAFWGIILVSVWQTAGYMMFIYIAGIINIPSEILDAAHIDGAGGLRILQSIMLPLIMPAFTICLFLTISSSFKAFDHILSLTGGGPYKSTEVVTMNIYVEAFTRSNMGLGSAKAMIFFVIIAAITLIQVWLTKRKEVEA
jgi:raffinose/stachyose/melibiose transport system permease protein